MARLRALTPQRLSAGTIYLTSRCPRNDVIIGRSRIPRFLVIVHSFDLHANVAVPAADRTRLEQLCRYLLRPAVAQDRLRLLADGRVALTLKTAWANGTRHLVCEPLELLEKLAVLTPRPRINLVLYHGVLAPHAGWRARVVAYGAPPGEVLVAASVAANASDEPTPAPNSRHWAWADLMRRAFELDVLACPRCGGRMRLSGFAPALNALGEDTGGVPRTALMSSDVVYVLRPMVDIIHRDLSFGLAELSPLVL